MPVKKIVFIAVAFALLSGCGREFEPYWRVLDFRVLAVKSSYPELRPGQTAEFSALTYTNTEDPITYQWEWCPFRTNAGDNFECPITGAELSALLAQQGGLEPDALPPFDFDLGTAPTATFPYPAPQSVLDEYCKSIQQFASEAPPEIAAAVPVVDCERGLEVSVRLVATSGDKEIVTGKKVTLWLGAEDLNQNPEVVDIQIRPTNVADANYLRSQGLDWVQDPTLDDGLWWVSLPQNTPLDIIAGVPFETRSLVDPITVDIWSPPAPQGADTDYLPPEKEVIVYRWMTTAGTYDPSERIFKDELNTLEEASITAFELTKRADGDFDDDGIADAQDPCPATPANGDIAEDDCTMTIWSIVRDGRYGTNWADRQLNVVGVRR